MAEEGYDSSLFGGIGDFSSGNRAMSRPDSPTSQNRNTRPTSSSSASSTTSQSPYFTALPNRTGGLLASRRARQIQADEGIVPAPYRPPAMRQGASNAEQLGASIQSNSIISDSNSPSLSTSIEDNPTSGGSRLFRGRARAGTLPSSWNNANDQLTPLTQATGGEGSIGVIGSPSGTPTGRPWSQSVSQFGPILTSTDNLGVDSIGSLRSSPSSLTSTFSSFTQSPNTNAGLSASRIPSSRPFRSNSALEFDKIGLRPHVSAETSPSSAFSPPSSFDTSGTTSSLQSNRNRSGSLASTIPPGLGNNAFGPSIFSSTWADQPGQSRLSGSLKPVSRRSSTLMASSAEEQPGKNRLTFDVESGNVGFQDEQSLDRSQEVHTLDYLGLEQDESGNNRVSPNPLGQPLRTRASTMASVPPRGSTSIFSSQNIGNGSSDRVGAHETGSSTLLNDTLTEDFYTQALQHGLDANQLAAVASAVGLPLPSTGLTSSQTGRLRAGTVAALGGPGGRQRIEQELRRMTAMATSLGSNGQGMNSLLNSLRGASIGSESRYSKAPLEAFPYVDIHTPPIMTPSRSSPFQTSPSTPLTSASNGGKFSNAEDQSLWQQTTVSSNAVPTSTEMMARSTNQLPSRSLWIGNLDSNITGQELMRVFAPYGAIESLRLLPEKECGFVNFVETHDAIRARDDVLGRLSARLEHFGTGVGGTVRIGFGKIDSAPSHTVKTGIGSGQITNLSNSGTGSFQGSDFALGTNNHLEVGIGSAAMTPGGSEGTSPTRALWVGSIPSSVTPAILLSIFQPFGPVESARILTHKNCGFINFERVDDAVRARKMLNGRDVLGSEVGAMRIGFAKVPARNVESYPTNGNENASFESAIDTLQALKVARSVQKTPEQQILSGDLENYRSNLMVNLLNQRDVEMGGNLTSGLGIESPQAIPHSNKQSITSSSSSIVPASDKGGVPLPAHMAPKASMSDLQLLMSQLSAGQVDREADVASVADYRPSATYYMTIPLVSEVSSGRRFETSKLREMRRNIESGQYGMRECDQLAMEHLDSIVDLASDYIGNTLVQKFFEHCSDQVKTEMIQRLAPHLAMTGCHKNGTWAVQKILDCSKSREQITLIAQHLRPYIPGLLLDQFGNYVVQCCLPWQQPLNDFVFDAMADRCWEIAQGRFGARSMKACLEKDNVTDQQRKRVAMAVILNSVPLATSPNGSILLTWLLDTPGLSKSYKLLAPRFAPHLTHLCTHKLASSPVLRIINQKFEPEASRTILSSLFDSTEDSVLEDIVVDQVHGSQFVTKVLASQVLTREQQERYSSQVKILVEGHHLVGVPAYRRLCEDLGLLSPTSFNPPAGSDRNVAPSSMSQRTAPLYQSYPEMAYGGLPMSSNSPMPAMAPSHSMLGPSSQGPPQDAFNPYMDSSSGLYKYHNATDRDNM